MAVPRKPVRRLLHGILQYIGDDHTGAGLGDGFGEGGAKTPRATGDKNTFTVEADRRFIHHNLAFGPWRSRLGG